MKKKYLQLTLEQRYKIEVLKEAKFNQTQIAELVGVHRSTICREYKRNISNRGRTAHKYSSDQAQNKASERHTQKPKHIGFTAELKEQVRVMMREEKLSPELISGKWKDEGKPHVSHETIYTWIWDCKHTNRQENKPDKKLYLELRHARRRSKRTNSRDNRGLLQHRVSITERPLVVNDRERLGDLEADLIIGKDHKGGLLVTLDRASMLTTIDKIESKKPDHIKELFMHRHINNEHLKTITFDNDLAFALHHEIATELGIETFFTRPYTSQDKGSIENRNGVIRRFFPKKTDFTNITKEEIAIVEKKINERPIRKFKYKSAKYIHSKKSAVALVA